MITKLVSYETTDGSVFESLREARIHEGEVELSKLLDKSRHGGTGRDLRITSVLFRWLSVNQDEIRKIMFLGRND